MRERSVDVCVVGGGAAGLSAALVLARSRRSVLVVDAGAPRNAPAAAMHAFLTRDGTPPAAFLAAGRDEVVSYGGEVEAGTVVGAERTATGFRVRLEDGSTVDARRLVVTTGLVDELPDVPGVAERWGRDVVHCPYCHGWEVRDRAIGVLVTSALSLHQASLFRQLSARVVLLTDGGDDLPPEQLAGLAARGVERVGGRVVDVEVQDDAIAAVRLEDGRRVPLEVLVVTPRFVARAELLEALGLQAVEHPSGVGSYVPADELGATSVPGVWVAGNVADPSAQVVTAAAQGNRVGAMVNADLVAEETAAALATARATDDEAVWDAFYAGESGDVPHWSGQPNPTLVQEAGGLEPGRALDVGCGEGADAIWLARAGWKVTAIDPSGVALGRAMGAADEAGVAVDWVRTGLLDLEPDGPFDLVTAHYPVLPRGDDDATIATLLEAVAPGGTLLFVHHEPDPDRRHHQHGEAADATGHGFDPTIHAMPDSVAARLDDRWQLEVLEARDRAGRPGVEHTPRDLVLRARRLS